MLHMAMKKQDAVYDLLLSNLVSGSYRFGQSILVKEVAVATGASKQPIMSALRQLQAEGFVRITAQVGCHVVAPEAAEMGDFFLMFSRMEATMAELAAQRGGESEADRLGLINAQIRRLPRRDASSGERYRLLNREFHGVLHAMSRSSRLHEQLRSSWAMSDFLISQADEFSRHISQAADEHDEIVDAVRLRNGPAARRAMEAHILEFRMKVLDALVSRAGETGTRAAAKRP
jgi:DNA-binding GntR family transcriptional regulator